MLRNWIVLRARREWTRARQFLCWLRRVNVTMLGTKLRLNLLFRSKTNKLKKILQQGVCVFFYSVVICCSCGVSDLLCVRNESVCVYLTRVCICFAWIPFRLFCPCRDFVQIRSTAYSYGSWTVVCEKESRRKRQKEQKIVEKSVKRNVHTKKKCSGVNERIARKEKESGTGLLITWIAAYRGAKKKNVWKQHWSATANAQYRVWVIALHRYLLAAVWQCDCSNQLVSHFASC